MASPLEGLIAQQIGAAMSSLFLHCTLTRGFDAYSCRAIYEEWGKGFGAPWIKVENEYKILVLATTLAIEPDRGDIITLQGQQSIIGSNSSKPSVSKDPASAVWTLLCKPYIAPNSLTGLDATDWPRTISIKRPAVVTQGGLQGYQGATIGGETIVVADAQCQILIASAGRTKLAEDLPDDSPKVQWVIEIPTNGADLPMIWEGDRIYDDLGRRFEVSAYEPQALSAKITAVRLRS